MISRAIHDLLEQLEREEMAEVSLELSDEERWALAEIRIEKNLNQFDYFGTPSLELKTDLEIYLMRLGENNMKDVMSVANIVLRLARGMANGFGEEWVWVMVRVFLPIEEFIVPRWHQDGGYFKSEKKIYKLATALKGPQTLFGRALDPVAAEELVKAEGKNYVENGNNPEKFDEEDLRIRIELSNLVMPIKIGKAGSAVLFLVGKPDAVLHSEPNVTEPRILVTVVTGQESQISHWQKQKAELQ